VCNTGRALMQNWFTEPVMQLI